MNILRITAFFATVLADLLSFNRALNSVASHVVKSQAKNDGMSSYAFGKYRLRPIVSDPAKTKRDLRNTRNKRYRMRMIQN